jgi:hypothetical protein
VLGCSLLHHQLSLAGQLQAEEEQQQHLPCWNQCCQMESITTMQLLFHVKLWAPRWHSALMCQQQLGHLPYSQAPMPVEKQQCLRTGVQAWLLHSQV